MEKLVIELKALNEVYNIAPMEKKTGSSAMRLHELSCLRFLNRS